MTPEDINKLVEVANQLQNTVQAQQHLSSELREGIQILFRALAPPTHERASIDTLLDIHVKCREYLEEAAHMLSAITDDPRPQQWMQFLNEGNPEMMYHRLMSYVAQKEEEIEAVSPDREASLMPLLTSPGS